MTISMGNWHSDCSATIELVVIKWTGIITVLVISMYVALPDMTKLQSIDI